MPNVKVRTQTIITRRHKTGEEIRKVIIIQEPIKPISIKARLMSYTNG